MEALLRAEENTRVHAYGTRKEPDVETKTKKAGKTAVREYLKRLDFGRKIHLRVDDGALLALCEDYRDEDPKPAKK
jgi:hypothetical protein